ncbi:ribonuclease HII [Maribacter hydrothermalis]|uniref:Ribonuclease HII n=1 Tax=Maribacter hydrothermalis TaxID=1836467 RepID=A0A1B7Z9I8_9FLAO|nr:ribonuclease HII [Maribacter hydrothermalis]APQ16689.1 ribonuclease HII [Maribacter hydrothermalis]OBR39398.1 ribonuclease HII [Maribacter hydrothermalis]
MLFKFYKNSNETGTDEAGRGCLAGPVTAAAVILPENFENQILTDSKLLSEGKRSLLEPILKRECVTYGIAHIQPRIIEDINILNASILAMHNAIELLSKTPSHIIVDGNKFKTYKNIEHTCIIKGDSKYMSIAAASVLAKTARDAYMLQIHEEYPMYNWKKNKGYPTKEHRAAIKKYGATKYHRMSFKLLADNLP